ncbi:MAG: amidohydrolase, partial [Armatimonadota bacterium]
DEQIERLAKLNPFVTFQPEFLAAFGHLYRRRLGEARARSLMRMRSVLDAGIRVSFSSDRPIVSGDPWLGMRSAVHREDGGEVVTRSQALHAYTEGAAAANGDAGQLGTLVIGARADWQVTD